MSKTVSVSIGVSHSSWYELTSEKDWLRDRSNDELGCRPGDSGVFAPRCGELMEEAPADEWAESSLFRGARWSSARAGSDRVFWMPPSIAISFFSPRNEAIAPFKEVGWNPGERGPLWRALIASVVYSRCQKNIMTCRRLLAQLVTKRDGKAEQEENREQESKIVVEDDEQLHSHIRKQ